MNTSTLAIHKFSTKLSYLAFGVAAFIALTSAHAANTATATASVTVITPLSIASNQNLQFGNIAASAAAGTVVLTAAATTSRTATGGVDLSSTGTAPTAAKFTVTGANSAGYSVTLPSSAITLTSSSNTMTVDTFTSSLSGGNGTLSSSGSDSFYVAAKLNVAASQATGTYSGSFSVSVNYN